MSFLDITIVLASAPRVVREWQVRLPAPAVVADALVLASGLQNAVTAAGLPERYVDCKVGIWGKLMDVGHALRDHDRIEIYRPLTVDPKVARRERFKKQGRRSAGLFTKKQANLVPTVDPVIGD